MPVGKEMSHASQAGFNDVAVLINNRPRKILV
jgi:IS30 family transposase